MSLRLRFRANDYSVRVLKRLSTLPRQHVVRALQVAVAVAPVGLEVGSFRPFVPGIDEDELLVRGVFCVVPDLGDEMAEPVGATFRDVTGNLRLGMTMDAAL